MTALTLIGRGPSWKDCAFITDELWGTATCLITPGLESQAFTKVFAFDNDKDITQAVTIAKERDIPIVSTYDFATEQWPVREIVNEFRSSYFLNSMSRMLAYAIYLKYTKLYIHGIDQGPAWGLQQGKPHISFWLGVATGRGINYRLGRGSLGWAYGVGEKPDADPIPDPAPLSEALIC